MKPNAVEHPLNGRHVLADVFEPPDELGLGDAPTDAELRVAKAQLVGWLEGLFHGIQATLFAQQMAARQQLEQMRQLPQADNRDPRPGTYL